MNFDVVYKTILFSLFVYKILHVLSAMLQWNINKGFLSYLISFTQKQLQKRAFWL